MAKFKLVSLKIDFKMNWYYNKFMLTRNQIITVIITSQKGGFLA
ncbi:MAG: hypothetical protein Q7R49_04065 [Candidatus Daviesbacteria bacterium]|nr:hypothetical protein [Candidatus Daviesbacteria bacterium]